MQRRSNKMAGCVAFPTGNPAWRSSGEGGMVVKLVVVSKAEFDDPANPQVCAGAQVFDVLTEVLVGDDSRPYSEAPEAATLSTLAEHERRRAEWEGYHYPNLVDAAKSSASACIDPYLSRDYLAAIVMGSTGWSGRNEEGSCWTCTFEDQTDAGKALYRQMAEIYPGATLHLLTFLDT